MNINGMVVDHLGNIRGLRGEPGPEGKQGLPHAGSRITKAATAQVHFRVQERDGSLGPTLLRVDETRGIYGTRIEPLPGTLTEDALDAPLRAKVNAAAGRDEPTRRLAAPISLGHGTTANYPRPTVVDAEPIFTIDDTVLPSLYWFQVLRVREVLGEAALDNYYAWYSTDHGTFGSGPDGAGIGMAHGPTPRGPWTEVGRIIDSSTPGSGQQPESPKVIWSPEEQLFFIFFSVNVALQQSVQHTRMFKTPTGYDQLVDSGLRLVAANNDLFTDGHTGYFNPFRDAGAWHALGLLGGTDYGMHGLWHGNRDASKWQYDPRPLGNQSQWVSGMLGGYNEIIEHAQFQVFEYRGRLHLLACVTRPTSGGVTAPTRWVVGPLSSNYRTFAQQPVDITPPKPAWAGDYMIGPTGVLVDDGRIYIYFRSQSEVGGFGVAEVEL